ncbi:MAG: polysaccharide pyruvyl transferase family protein [bacterium]|nr:polysaccharide pyruvyl transferase family protein [bacterium]
MAPKIFINGYFGYYNLGDDLLLELFTQMDLRPYELWLLTREKYYTMKKKVRFLDRFNLFRLFFLIKKEDILINLGGIFQDKTSSLSFYYYYLVNLMFLFRKASVGFLNTDFVDIYRGVNRRLIRFLIRKSKFTVIRNKLEFRYYQKRFSRVYFLKDLVFFLKARPIKSLKRYILMVLRPDRKWKLRKILAYVKKLDLPYKILIMKNEKRFYHILQEHVPGRSISVYQYHNRKEILRLVAGAGSVLTMRYHLAVLGMLFKRKVRIIPVNNKLKLLRKEHPCRYLL